MFLGGELASFSYVMETDATNIYVLSWHGASTGQRARNLKASAARIPRKITTCAKRSKHCALSGMLQNSLQDGEHVNPNGCPRGLHIFHSSRLPSLYFASQGRSSKIAWDIRSLTTRELSPPAVQLSLLTRYGCLLFLQNCH